MESVLEKINLLLIGLASVNSRISVPSNIPDHNMFIPAEHLKSQKYLNEIQEWTNQQKMILNSKKTKTMIFNFSDNYQFTTSLKLGDDPIEVAKKHKLLGLIISDDLKWDDNTDYLVKRVYARLEILRKCVIDNICSRHENYLYLVC